MTLMMPRDPENQHQMLPGQLWTLHGRPVVVCGNATSPNGTVWCMRWFDGQRVDPVTTTLRPHSRCLDLTHDDLVRQFHEWACEGNSHAMWWLAWLFEGVNHTRSTWYYVAALRANPSAYGWLQRRIISDARSACMEQDRPKPDLEFLACIPEIQGASIGSDWAAAVTHAEILQPEYHIINKPNFTSK